MDLDKLKNELLDFKNNADKAQVQEEFMLKQLKELFECETFDEGMELLEMFLSDQKNFDNQIDLKTDELYQKMKSKGLL